jgi:hypothetical protein
VSAAAELAIPAIALLERQQQLLVAGAPQALVLLLLLLLLLLVLLPLPVPARSLLDSGGCAAELAASTDDF